MKKMSFRLLISMISIFTALIFTTTSCDNDDDGDGTSTTKPVIGENVIIAQDANNVTLTTTLTASAMWVKDTTTKVTTDFVSGVCELFIPIKGDYVFTCTAIVGGIEYTSEPFSITIAATNTAFLEKGIWKALTGGPAGGKVWKLDLKEFVAESIDDAGVKTSISTYGSEYFHAALDFYGDDEAGALGNKEDGTSNDWGPWGGTNIYGWGGTPEIGTITFDGLTGKATLNLIDGTNIDGDQNVETGVNENGEPTYTPNPTDFVGTLTGNFSMQAETRDPDFVRSIPDETLGTISLWEHMLAYKYSYLGTLSEETADLKLAGDLRFPMDKGRVGEGQFLMSDLQNVKIIHCTDSALVVRVKRTYEGFEDASTHKASSCWLLYNYIVEGLSYSDSKPVLLNSEIVNNAATTASIEGSYKIADITGDWIGWSTKDRLNTYASGAEMGTLFSGWGVTDTEAKHAASQKSTITFASGNVSISDVSFVNGAEVTNTYSTTYSVSGGYITFGESVTITAYSGMITLAGINLYVISTPATGTEGSLWIGQNNENKKESKAVQLIKQ